MTQLWQPGTELRKYDGFSAMTGKHIFTTLYVSWYSGFDSMYKYISPSIKFDKQVYGGGKNRLRTILREMKQASQELNAPYLLYSAKRSWLDYLLSSENFDDEEVAYYQGIKRKRMFEFFDEEGWGMFAEKEMPPSHWERHTVRLYILSCPRSYPQELCDQFEKGAIKYGYYFPPVPEPTPEEIVEKINTDFQEKFMLGK